MPSPVGHGLAGLALHVLSARDERELGSLARAVTLAALASAPDLDFALAWLQPGYHHQGEVHSLGAALIVAGIAAAAAWVRKAPPWRWAWLAGAVWSAHVLMDVCSVDTRPPIGPMAFWPLSGQNVHAAYSLFLDTWRSPDWRTVRHDTLAIGWELALLAPAVAVLWRWRARRLGAFTS